MDRHIREFVNILSDLFDFPEPIWEIGSYLVTGQEELGNLRNIFQPKEFIGVDLREGPGVDRIENIEKINAPDESVGSLLCLNTLEHVWDFFAALREMHRVLKPGGILVVSTPFDFIIHNYPGDYWRFSPQALNLLTQDFPTRLIGYHGYEHDPRMTLAVAFKQNSMPQLQVKVDQLKDRFRQVAKPNRLHIDRRIKLALARKLAGERFFRTHKHYGDIDFWIERNDSYSNPRNGK